jgi:hypothetical protein
MRRLLLAASILAATTMVAATSATADVKITDREPYVRHDGGTDATIASCSRDTPTAADGGERQQNEPTATIDPLDPSRMTAGSNDYCAVPTTTDAYGGFYYSTNSGASWTDSLLPGYPTDTSAEGSDCNISPQHCLVINTGDPVQAWDRWKHVFYGVIGFNRDKPSNGSIFVARYDWPNGAAPPDYRWTALVKRGTPSQPFSGQFNDKIQVEVDRGVNSPYAGSAARPWGNVYVCWARFVGVGGNNGVFFSRSTDGGRTYSNPQKISAGIHDSQFCDIGVTSNGTVFVAWRQIESSRGHQTDGVAWAKSTNGGASFTKPAIATRFEHWDAGDEAGSAEERKAAMEAACEAGDGIECAEREVEEAGSARDCGDGPFVCQSGYVFFRVDSQVRITADPTDTSNSQAAYIVYSASVPGSETDTGTTYGTIEPGIGSQGAIYFIRTLNGSSWSNPVRVSPQAKGHQLFPDIDANAGKLHVVWQDSRNDTASGPPDTPSLGDYRTVPISNRWVSNNPPGSVSTGMGVETFYSSSTNQGTAWSAANVPVSGAAQMPQYEQFGNRDIPFFGDYNYIAAVGSKVLMTWTDQRETKPGDDPRYTDGDGTDGFDVLQCRPMGDPFGADTCPNAGGLDQNIFGAIIP